MRHQTHIAHEFELTRLHQLSQEFARVLNVDASLFLELLPPAIQGSLEDDHSLLKSHCALRQLFLQKMGNLTSHHWRTPETGQQHHYPGSDQPYTYAYDRQHPPRMLDSRLFSIENGGTGNGLVCASGMAAIGLTMRALAYLLKENQPALGVLASYFESLTQFRVGPFAQSWQRLADSDSMATAIKCDRYAIVYIEPVQYNWQLEVVDLTPVINAINSTDHPPVVILDTTLSGNCTALQELTSRLKASRTPLLITLRSGLKFDQQGLELSNLGVIQWWLKQDSSLRSIAAVLTACRTVDGAGIGWHEACTLAPNFILHQPTLAAYTQAIFSANRQLFEALNLSGAIFCKKVYPDLPWGAPFVLLVLTAGDKENYVRLAQLLYREARRRNLRWQMSGSFGFRTEHFETILPEEQLREGEAPAGVLKIACGCYQGARFWHIVDLLNELAAFSSLEHALTTWKFNEIGK